MRKTILLTSLILLVLVAAAGAALLFLNDDIDTPGPSADGGCDPTVQRTLDAWGARGFSGSLAVSTDGRFDCLAAFGTADDATKQVNQVDTPFSIGSVSKSFTAAAILKLQAAGKLQLTDRAGNLVPGLGGEARRVTVEQLLVHTSGLPVSHAGDLQPMGQDQAVKAISRLKLAFEPGERFLYTNAGYTLLALIVDELAPDGFRPYLVSDVLELPDGARAGGFWNGDPRPRGTLAVGYTERGRAEEQGDFTGPHWALTGNGDLAMSARDLATWTHEAFAGGLLPAQAARTMASTGFDQGEGQTSTPGWVAYDAERFGVPLLVSAGGGGSGHNAVVVWSPQTKQVVAATSNRPGISAEDLVQAIGPALLAGEPLPLPQRPGRRVDPRELADVAGRYELPSGGSLAVRARAGGLAVTARGRDAVKVLLPIGDQYDAETVAAHEQRVAALLRGETDEGRKERQFLEKELGPIGTFRFEGTIAEGGELRTYVTVNFPQGPNRLWIALDEEGGIAAAEASATPPSTRVVPLGGRRFELEDPTGRRTPVTIRFEDETMTIESATGPTTARRTGGEGK